MQHNFLKPSASLMRFFSTATVMVFLVSLPGCNEEQEIVDVPVKVKQNKIAKTNDNGDAADDTTVDPNPVTPQAAVLAAVNDAKAKLSNADIKGFIEHYMPLERFMYLREGDGVTREAARMAGNIKSLNAMIKSWIRPAKVVSRSMQRATLQRYFHQPLNHRQCQNCPYMKSKSPS